MLITENYTGLPDSESYVSVEDCTAYHVRMGNKAWADSDVIAQEAALRKATQYIDARYRFKGNPMVDGQALAHPTDAFSYPLKRLLDATCELALRALDEPLFKDHADVGNIRSETIGPISTTFSDPVREGQTKFAIVDSLLYPLTTRSLPVKLVRS